MKVISSLLLAVAVGSSKVRFAVAEDKPACGEAYTCSNGNTAGPVVDADSCQEACESCEGSDWRCGGGYKEVEIIEGNSTVTYARCECGKVSSTSTCTTNEWRLSCVDPEYTKETSSASIGCGAGIGSVLVAAGLAMSIL